MATYTNQLNLFSMLRRNVPYFALTVFVILMLAIIAHSCAYGAQSQTRLWSAAQIAAWKQAANLGPYRTDSDWCPHSPGDWARVVAFRKQFVRRPLATAKASSSDTVSLHTGYQVGGVPNLSEGYPVWAGRKAQATAFHYLLTNNDSSGAAVRVWWLAQMSQTSNYAFVGNWTSGIAYEAGKFEAEFLSCCLYTVDMIWDRLSSAERTQSQAYFTACALWFYTKAVTGAVGQDFPQIEGSSFSQVGRNASAAYCEAYTRLSPAEHAYFAKERSATNGWAGDGYIHLYRDAAGQAGPVLTRLAQDFNNRTGSRIYFVGLVGLYFNNAGFANLSIGYHKAWMIASVYANGTFGEYERNGDYGNPSQGAHWYGAEVVQTYTMTAYHLWRLRGDSSLFAFKTAQGFWGTECQGGQTKSLLTVIGRQIDNMRGVNPLYYNTISEANRICHRNPNNVRQIDQCGTGYLESPFDYTFAVANAYYRRDNLKNAYLRYSSGIGPYTGNMASAAKCYLSWGGTDAALPGVLFMFANKEGL